MVNLIIFFFKKFFFNQTNDREKEKINDENLEKCHNEISIKRLKCQKYQRHAEKHFQNRFTNV